MCNAFLQDQLAVADEVRKTLSNSLLAQEPRHKQGRLHKWNLCRIYFFFDWIFRKEWINMGAIWQPRQGLDSSKHIYDYWKKGVVRKIEGTSNNQKNDPTYYMYKQIVHMPKGHSRLVYIRIIRDLWQALNNFEQVVHFWSAKWDISPERPPGWALQPPPGKNQRPLAGRKSKVVPPWNLLPNIAHLETSRKAASWTTEKTNKGTSMNTVIQYWSYRCTLLILCY